MNPSSLKDTHRDRRDSDCILTSAPAPRLVFFDAVIHIPMLQDALSMLIALNGWRW